MKVAHRRVRTATEGWPGVNGKEVNCKRKNSKLRFPSFVGGYVTDAGEGAGRAQGGIMGRAPIGASAKTETATVRMTAAEKRELARRFGTPGKGLRAFIDTAMRVAPVKEAGEEK